MKRLVFYSILILVFFAACDRPSDSDKDYTQDDTPPADGIASVTVYLDENGPPESRAMNRVFAEMSCDYFEVYFIGNDGSTTRTVSGQWKIGDKAGVSDVLRDIVYNGFSTTPAAGYGSAVLLAGKSDKTLMAVGRLRDADINITSTTTKVIFELNAIKCGVNRDIDYSSFLTAAKDTATGYTAVSIANTDVGSERLNDIYYMAFMLPKKQSLIKAEYTFYLNSASRSFGDYGLYVAAAGKAEKMHPAYTQLNGGNINTSLIILDERTTVEMKNNQASHAVFDPVVRFEFNTDSLAGETILGSIFALVFEIPVSALDIAGCRWYIRPSYGVLKYELDDGAGGNGGAVLIKTGEFSIPVVNTNFIIEVTKPPNKWRYRWTSVGKVAGDVGYRDTEPDHESPTYNSSQHAIYDREFFIDGLEVTMKEYGGSHLPIPRYPNNSGSITNSSGVFDNNWLTFIIGEKKVEPHKTIPGVGGAPATEITGYMIPDEFYGLVKVTVRFSDPYTNVSKEDTFYILVSGNYYAPGAGNSTYLFDYADPNLISSNISTVTGSDINTIDNNFNTALTNVNNQIRIIRLNVGFNKIFEKTTEVIAGNSRLYIIVAGASGVTLGRGIRNGVSTQGQVILIQGAASGQAGFYFGFWPFDGLESSPSSLNTSDGHPTYPFTVNTVGMGASGNNGYVNKFITDDRMYTDQYHKPGVGGGIYNVELGKGVTILPNDGTHGMLH